MNRLDPRTWTRKQQGAAGSIYGIAGLFAAPQLFIPLPFIAAWLAYRRMDNFERGSAVAAFIGVIFVLGTLQATVPFAATVDTSNSSESHGGQPTVTTTAPTHTITSTQTNTPTSTMTSASTRTESPTQTPNPTTDTPTATPTPEQSSGSDAPIEGGTSRSAVVTRVIDADTVEVEYSGGGTDTVRLIGVDSPEVTSVSKTDPEEFGYGDTSGARDYLYNWGTEAESFAVEQLDGESVRVVTDPAGDRRGYYGRLLAYIYHDGSNFNQQLVESGYARRYDSSSFTLKDEFGSLEADAQDANKRVWGYDGSSASTPTPSGTSGGDRDCGSFDSHEQAQTFFENHNPDGDPHRLDRDGNGQACENL